MTVAEVSRSIGLDGERGRAGAPARGNDRSAHQPIDQLFSLDHRPRRAHFRLIAGSGPFFRLAELSIYTATAPKVGSVHETLTIC